MNSLRSDRSSYFPTRGQRQKSNPKHRKSGLRTHVAYSDFKRRSFTARAQSGATSACHNLRCFTNRQYIPEIHGKSRSTSVCRPFRVNKSPSESRVVQNTALRYGSSRAISLHDIATNFKSKKTDLLSPKLR